MGFEPTNQEAISSPRILLRDLVHRGDLIEAPDHVTLAARHVKRGGDYAATGTPPDKILLDGKAIAIRRRLQDVSREMEFVCGFGHLCQGNHEVPI